MIQRIQSLWFLLSAVSGFAMTQIPLFSARLANNAQRQLLATESLLLFALVMALTLLALACLFLFKKRSLQFKLAVFGVLGSIGAIALEVYFIEQFKEANAIISGAYQWGGLFPILMILFFFMGARGVYKDEKLVKSLDRLR